MCIVIEDMTSSSLSFSNHSPYLKLVKVCPCCVGSASRHGQLFTVSLKSQPIYQSFQSLFFVVCMLLADMASCFQSLQITAHFSCFPRFIFTFVHAASRHGQLFSVLLELQPISKAFQGLFLVKYVLLSCTQLSL